MVVSEHMNPTVIEKRILMFNWRMGVTADFNNRLKKYQGFMAHVEQINDLSLHVNKQDMEAMCRKYESSLMEILQRLQNEKMSAFHQDVGMN